MTDIQDPAPIWTTYVHWGREASLGEVTFALPGEKPIMIHYSLNSIEDLESLRASQRAHNPRQIIGETPRFENFHWNPGYVDIDDYSEVGGRIRFDREKFLRQLSRALKGQDR